MKDESTQTKWISVREAAALMQIGHREALRRLGRLNVELEGRLLRKIGDKKMPSGVQASKFLVNILVLKQSMEPDPEALTRDVDELRVALALTNQKLEALRKSVRGLLRKQH